MKANKPAIPSTATALACLTAITVAGYTLYVSRMKDVETTQNEDDKATDDPVAAASTSRSIALENETLSDSIVASGAEPQSEISSDDKPPVQQIDTGAPVSNVNSALTRIQAQNTITIAYASTTGTCKNFAASLHETLTDLLQRSEASTATTIQLCTVDELDWWDELLNDEGDEVEEEKVIDDAANDRAPLVVFVLPTWTGGTLPEQHSALLTSLNEICHDWRVAPKPLRSASAGAKQKKAHFSDNKTLQVACFGMGSSAYDNSTFCKPAKDVFKYFMKLGARSFLTSHGKSVVGTGDDDAGDCKAVFQEWAGRIIEKIEEVHSLNTAKSSLAAIEEEGGGTSGCCKNGTKDASNGCGCEEQKTNEDTGGCCSTDNQEDAEVYSDGDDYDDDESAYESDYDLDEEKEPDVMDLEDIGNAMKASADSSKNKNRVPKEMVTPKQAAALKKEGYRIIGTHSAVKLCRWTKHQLRGRGGCYKHTFYGITSYQCMEATPSLACANKCKWSDIVNKICFLLDSLCELIIIPFLS